MVVPSLNRPRQATPDPLSVLPLLEDEQKYQNAHKIDENMPRTKDEAHWPKWPGRPTPPLGRLTKGQAYPGSARKHKCTQIQPQDQASNVSKGQKCTKLRIHNIINPREEQSGQCRPDTWSPDLLHGRPTYPRKHFTHATTVLNANRHGEARSSRWNAKSVDRVVGQPRCRSADLSLGRPTTDLGLPLT
ncbi:hypothetical protein U9M48_003939 [Paspalum notatum var. saurae]|uniref:Uncharacterized protein n=1 Tax=Paspalum notatum var. saurae TaxID=547442 RepID=A0AAQ3PLX7_PASNO